VIRRDGATGIQCERLDKIDAAGRHLLEIINAVLELSKIEAGKLELHEGPVDLREVLRQVVSLVQDRATAKGLQVTVEAPFGERLIGDGPRLQQALLNYAANAVKFTDAGFVAIRVTLAAESEHSVLARFEVEDSGPGIPESALPKLFSAFEQADNSSTRSHGGTGLGLSITRRLARLMGGDAGARSVAGRGSTFWFTARLGVDPVAAAAHPDSPADAEAALRAAHAGKRVLLVEDEPINLEVARSLLEDAGLVVDVCEDGLSAVARASAARYDLVLMDVQMPRMSGLDATVAIRKLDGWSAVPIVALTANAFAEDRAACLRAGMNDFITKPIEPERLFGLLARWLRSGTSSPKPERAPETA